MTHATTWRDANWHHANWSQRCPLRQGPGPDQGPGTAKEPKQVSGPVLGPKPSSPAGLSPQESTVAFDRTARLRSRPRQFVRLQAGVQPTQTIPSLLQASARTFGSGRRQTGRPNHRENGCDIDE